MHSRRPSTSSLPPIDTHLVPTTDRIAQHCPRFRILIVGRSGAGKSSLINAIFNASLADVRHDGAGTADINEGIASEHNKHLIIHDSEGYEPGDKERLSVLEKFIRERSQMGPVGERLHAIWLCITAPHAGGTMFQPWDEKIFRINQRKVPIIVVYTKVDLIIPKRRLSSKDRGCRVSAETYFKERYGQSFETSTKNIEGEIPYTAVATSLPATLKRLVDITGQTVHVDTPSPTSAHPRGQDEDLADSAEIALAMAQRVDMPAKIAASIKVGKKKYWRAIASGIHFLNVSMEKCLFAIHKDIVTIWNIRDLDKTLLSDEFRRRMKVVVEDLSRPDQMNTRALQGKIPIAAAAGLASAWTNGVYKRLPEHIRCLVGYVVDLTLILEAVFRVSLEEHLGKEALRERLDEIICEFHLSERKKAIHTAIWAFVGPQRPFAKAMVDKIESLINGNEMTMKDMRFDEKRPPLPSLITVIRYERSVKGQIVNKITLHLMRKLLESPDFGSIDSELGSTSDVELLLNFILHLLRHGNLSNFGIRDAGQKARKLMNDLISKRNVMPGQLFLTDIKTGADVNGIAIGGFGRVFKGEHKGQQVALKVLGRSHKNGSLRKDGGREALAWRSLTKHRYILPLHGVFEDKLQLFLVLPFMTNGTLSEWRKWNKAPFDIHKRILEVAEGIQHIHSEGIVHGDLRGENILLDANFHCQIADVGLTQSSDAIFTLSASAFLFNYAAPELFVTQSESDVMHEDHDMQKGSKTVKTDIYAFGCLYYAIFFNSVPFQGKYEYQIMQLITSGGRPRRLENPKMDNGTWTIIQSCWRANPLLRPSSEEIRTQMMALGF